MNNKKLENLFWNKKNTKMKKIKVIYDNLKNTSKVWVLKNGNTY